MLVNEVLGEEMDLYYRLHAIVLAAYLTRSRSELARHLMRVDCCARARGIITPLRTTLLL